MADLHDRGELPEIAVSHPSDWGLPVPVPGFDDQRIYVWLEMAPGYALQAGESDSRVGPIQCFGFDNAYFHALLFPAAYLATGEAMPLATAYVVNEFYRLEGEKFSTSRGYAIWGSDFLREVPSDALRFHLCLTGPEYRRAVHSMRLDESLLGVLAALTGDPTFRIWRPAGSVVRLDSTSDVPRAVYEHALACEHAHATLIGMRDAVARTDRMRDMSRA